MLNALVHRENGNVTCIAQPPVPKETLQVDQHARTPIACQKCLLNEIRRGEMERFFGNTLALIIEKQTGRFTQQIGNGFHNKFHFLSMVF